MARLYAIVGEMGRARLMLEARVPYLQLRFKERPLTPYLGEIAGWAALYPATRVIVNDDLALAGRAGVWGVHLGQEDLQRHSPQALRQTQLALGISTHSDREIGQALRFSPALLGFGPIFPTGSKDVSNPPQGVGRLREVSAAQSVPIVAIGGIGEETLDAVTETGVPMVAMIAYLDRFHTADDLAQLMERMAR